MLTVFICTESPPPKGRTFSSIYAPSSLGTTVSPNTFGAGECSGSSVIGLLGGIIEDGGVCDVVGDGEYVGMYGVGVGVISGIGVGLLQTCIVSLCSALFCAFFLCQY